MDIATAIKAAGDLTLLALLFGIWRLERAERIAIQAAYNKHMEDDISKLDDTIEALQKGG